jgi:hypothetical protein
MTATKRLKPDTGGGCAFATTDRAAALPSLANEFPPTHHLLK